MAPASASASDCGYQIRTSGVSIPDGSFGSGTSDSIYIPPGGSLQDVDVDLDLTHPDDRDLDITLVHDGKSVGLSSDNPAGNAPNRQNYRGTVFDDEAATAITDGSAPFTGSFRPEESLTAFDGGASGGLWTLKVKDDTGTLDPGGGGTPPPQKINSWGIEYSAASCPTYRIPCDEVGVSTNAVFGPHVTLSDGFQIHGDGTVSAVTVHIRRLNHPTDSELDISLINDSQAVDLSTGNGGSGDNYVDTLFDQQANAPITTGAAPFTGSFTPEESLFAMRGSPVDSVWILAVINDGANSGTLVSWGVKVSAGLCPDLDSDAVYDTIDNCDSTDNPGQENYDSDSAGDACDTDDDNDAVVDSADRCAQGVRGPAGTAAPDFDQDGCKNGEDTDDDDDGVADTADACPRGDIGVGADRDSDGCKDSEQADDDSDGVLDPADDCPQGEVGVAADHDADGCSDAEDPDDDNDGVADAADACAQGTVGIAADHDGDGCRDAEDADGDNDGVANAADRCPAGAVGAAQDRDGDGCADASPEDTDDDGDTVPDATDKCPLVAGAAPFGCPLTARTVRLKVKRAGAVFSFTGSLTGTAVRSCLSKQRIAVRRIQGGPDPRLGKGLRTSLKGKFKLRHKAPAGRYYAYAPVLTLANRTTCAAASSKPVRIRPRRG